MVVVIVQPDVHPKNLFKTTQKDGTQKNQKRLSSTAVQMSQTPKRGVRFAKRVFTVCAICENTSRVSTTPKMFISPPWTKYRHQRKTKVNTMWWRNIGEVLVAMTQTESDEKITDMRFTLQAESQVASLQWITRAIAVPLAALGMAVNEERRRHYRYRHI